MRKFYLFPIILAFVAGSLTIAPCAVAKKKVPAKKPAAKKASPKLGQIGTAQMPGEYCEFGKAYTLGKESAMNITIKSVEYRATRIRIGDEIYWPLKDEKLLVVRFVMHNPLPREQFSNNFDWTCVDAQNNNHDNIAAGIENSSEILSMSLKQAQKVDAYTIFRVPAKGEVPKIIVKNHWDDTAPVARYTEMKKKIKPIEPPFVDTSDPTGATALSEVSAKIGTYYPTGLFDAKLEKVEFVTTDLLDETLNEGCCFAVLTFQVKNCGIENKNPAWGGGLSYEMSISDGSAAVVGSQLLSAAANRAIDLTLKPEAEGSFRAYFQVPNDTALGELTLREDEGRMFKYDLSSYKSPAGAAQPASDEQVEEQEETPEEEPAPEEPAAEE